MFSLWQTYTSLFPTNVPMPSKQAKSSTSSGEKSPLYKPPIPPHFLLNGRTRILPEQSAGGLTVQVNEYLSVHDCGTIAGWPTTHVRHRRNHKVPPTTLGRVNADYSHLMGMFYRTLRIIDNGIKPCYVFDGAPPLLKNGEVPNALFFVVLTLGSWRNVLPREKRQKQLLTKQRK